MNCKNCGIRLRTDFSFCPDCGGKIIRNRLTFKNLMHDFAERYFNVDNTFAKTFWHLFTKPEVVICGYIDGIRRKYLNPVSYLAISIILSGVLYYFLRKIWKLNLNNPELTELYANMGVEFDLNIIMDYQAVMTYINLPFCALITALIFIGKKKYNYTEHLVLNAYIIAHYSIVGFIITAPFLLLLKTDYTTFSMFYILFVAAYWIYVLKRVYQVSFGETILRSMATFGVLGIVFIVISILIGIIGAMTGLIDPDKFAPPK